MQRINNIDYYITADSIDAASQRLTAVYIYLQTQIKAEVSVHEKVTLKDLILSVGYAV